MVALTGPSGAGKSTFLNVMGLLERPTAGRIRIDGVETTGALDEAGLTRLRGRSLGFIFQFHHLLPAFTAQENVMMPLLLDRGRPDAAMRARAAELLGKVGLKDYLGRRPGKLSGGQQQRVAVARALAMSPPLVLADEPTGNLDTASADEVFALLRAFNRDFGVTFLVVTHDLAPRGPVRSRPRTGGREARRRKARRRPGPRVLGGDTARRPLRLPGPGRLARPAADSSFPRENPSAVAVLRAPRRPWHA